MNIDKFSLYKAQKEGIISTEQVEQLLEFFNSQNADPDSELRAKFNLTNFLYYFGAILIILAMCWFIGNIWKYYSETGVFYVSILYMIFFTLIGNYLWNKGIKTPGGLLYVASISSMPLITYCFEKITGIWPLTDPGNYNGFHFWIRDSWILMEITTILVGSIYLKFRKFPFITAPIAYAAWYLSMDIAPFLAGRFNEPTWDERKLISLFFGLILIAIAFIYDKRTKGDFSFWFYLFGGLTFWLGLSFSIQPQDEISYFIYAIINLLMMFVSLLLQRKVFIILGSLGILGYLTHLAYNLFKDSISFPLVLIAIGLITIFLGIIYQKNQEKIEKRIESFIPDKIKICLPKYRI